MTITHIIDGLKNKDIRDSTNATYLRIWRRFNAFLIKLDKMPKSWEDHTTLFMGYLIDNGSQSQSVKTYISAIKKALLADGYLWDDSKVLLNSLTKACKLKNDIFSQNQVTNTKWPPGIDFI